MYDEARILLTAPADPVRSLACITGRLPGSGFIWRMFTGAGLVASRTH
jgi:hypothetical protein